MFYLEKTIAETWAGKDGAPNLTFVSDDYVNILDARKAMQEEVARVCQTAAVESICWYNKRVEIKYNYLPNEGNRIEATLSIRILQIAPNKVDWVEIGSKPWRKQNDN